jgi:hypothetical protein
MENLYCKGLKGNSEKFRENISKIKWNNLPDYSNCGYLDYEGNCLLFSPSFPCLGKGKQSCIFGRLNDK